MFAECVSCEYWEYSYSVIKFLNPILMYYSEGFESLENRAATESFLCITNSVLQNIRVSSSLLINN